MEHTASRRSERKRFNRLNTSFNLDDFDHESLCARSFLVIPIQRVKSATSACWRSPTLYPWGRSAFSMDWRIFSLVSPPLFQRSLSTVMSHIALLQGLLHIRTNQTWLLRKSGGQVNGDLECTVAELASFPFLLTNQEKTGLLYWGDLIRSDMPCCLR